MKVLEIKMEKLMQYLQKKSLDANFKPKIYDLLDLEEVSELKLINENWMKIKVKLGGICGSNLKFLSLNFSTCTSFYSSFPATPGHENVGTISEVGDNIKDLSIGDRVVIEPVLPCSIREIEPCNSCKEGNYNLCSNFDQGIISPGAWQGICEDIRGGWGEYIIAHKSQVIKIPESVTFEEAVITEPFATSIQGVFKKLPKNNENCVVVGCGTIGLTTIMALKAFSKCNLIAVAKYPFQAELAKELGVDEVFLVKKDRHIKKIGKKLGCRVLSPVMEDVYPVDGGADIVIDSVGNESSLSNSLRLLRPKGTLILTGTPAYIKIDWSPMCFKEINLIPSMGYSNIIVNGKKQRTFQVALDLITSGQANVKNILTHKFSIDEYKNALEVASNKSINNSIKTAFVFE